MRIVFLGSGEFGLPTLQALHREHDLVGVVSQPDRPAGRKRHLTPTPVAAWAAEHGLPTLKPEDANQPDTLDAISAWRPDAAVVIAFGQKLSPPLIAALGRLAVNLHSSLLPKYRGAAPINWAMIRGETTTGVSVIGLAQRMDAGEVYARAELDIDPLETAGELHDRLAQLGPDAVLAVLRDLQHGALRPLPQDDTLATRAPKLSKADGTVDFNQPADAVRARVHGLTPWPGCRVTWRAATAEEKPLILGRVKTATPIPGSPEAPHGHAGLPPAPPVPGTITDHLRVACSDGFIELLELQAPGTKMMPATDFARGHGLKPGDTLHPLTPTPTR